MTGGLTGGLTHTVTQVSANKSSITQTKVQEELDTALEQLSKPEAELVNFIKYDTTLGREQNIELAKESSLANSERIHIKGGVKLTRFRPEKRVQQQATTIIDEAEDSDFECKDHDLD